MSNSYEPQNPYSSYTTGSLNQPAGDAKSLRERVQTMVTVPSIFLIVVGILGLLASIYSCVNALVADPPPVDPNAPEMVKEFTQGTVGPVAAAIQGFFIAFNAFIIFGAVNMLRFQLWPLALAASIAATINCGSCCLLLGAPVGIWSIVILARSDVKSAFRANA